MPNAIIPVILCGGSGTRLSPISTPDRPKPFLPCHGASLFQHAMQRAVGDGFDPCPIVVAAEQHAELVVAALADLNCAAEVIFEPFGRNTCATVAPER